MVAAGVDHAPWLSDHLSKWPGKPSAALRSWLQANDISWAGDITITITIAVDGKALLGTGGRTAKSRHARGG